MSAAAWCLLLLPTRLGSAAQPPIDLSWQAPPECPGRDAVLARMQRMLGASWAKLAPLRAAGVIEERGGGYELHLSIEGGKGGEREVFAQHCDQLGGVAAVALVLLLTSSGHITSADAAGGDSTSEPGDATAPGGAAEPKPPEVAGEPEEADPVDPFEPSRGVRARWRLLVQAPLFGLGIGPLPKPHPALGLGVGAAYGALSLRLIGQWGLAQEIPASTPGYGAEVRRLSAGLWACADLAEGIVSIAPCLQGSVTHVSGRGYGPSLRAASQNETSGAVGAGVLGRWQITGSLGLLLGGSAQVELSRPVLLLKPLGSFQQLAPVSATLLLGPEWIF